jgi:hypothetical protein
MAQWPCSFSLHPNNKQKHYKPLQLHFLHHILHLYCNNFFGRLSLQQEAGFGKRSCRRFCEALLPAPASCCLAFASKK